MATAQAAAACSSVAKLSYNDALSNGSKPRNLNAVIFSPLITKFPGELRLSSVSSFLQSTYALQALCRNAQQRVSASKKKRSSVLDFDEDDEDGDDFDDDADEFLDMEEWMKSKPVGFGTGKVYDTSLEEQLLEEIKRDKLAQAAAKKKKSTPAVKEVDDAPPEGVEVFVKNLPKKKNVDRDLRTALRSVSGLLHVRPIVTGNEKTREPVCKGLAYLTFATPDDAEEFVDRYNGESVLFGKVEKKIVCELAKSSGPHKRNPLEQLPTGPRLAVRDRLSEDQSLVTSTASSFSVENASGGDDTLTANTSSDIELVESLSDGNEEDEADLFELEQQIWDKLENEEDFDLDSEIEAEIEEQEEEGGEERSLSDETDDSAESNREGVRLDEGEDEYRSQVIGKGFGKSTVSVESRDQVRTPTTRMSLGSVDKKEKRIRELEAKLEELQSQLNKRNSMEFPGAKGEGDVSVSGKEQKIEAMEQRLLRRAKAGKDTNVSRGKPSPSTEKAGSKKGLRNSSSSALEKTSKERKPKPQQPRLKLGASSRLKKKEREIFTEALSKYSSSPRDTIST